MCSNRAANSSSSRTIFVFFFCGGCFCRLMNRGGGGGIVVVVVFIVAFFFFSSSLKSSSLSSSSSSFGRDRKDISPSKQFLVATRESERVFVCTSFSFFFFSTEEREKCVRCLLDSRSRLTSGPSSQKWFEQKRAFLRGRK